MQTIHYKTSQYAALRFSTRRHDADQGYTLNAYCKRSFLTQELGRRPLDSRGGIVWTLRKKGNLCPVSPRCAVRRPVRARMSVRNSEIAPDALFDSTFFNQPLFVAIFSRNSGPRHATSPDLAPPPEAKRRLGSTC